MAKLAVRELDVFIELSELYKEILEDKRIDVDVRKEYQEKALTILESDD